MIVGAPQHIQYTAEDIALLLSVHAELNTKLHHNHTSYEIGSISKQIVNGTTNTFLHILGQPGNHKYTITIH